MRQQHKVTSDIFFDRIVKQRGFRQRNRRRTWDYFRLQKRFQLTEIGI